MNSVKIPQPDQVISDLGALFIHAVINAVSLARRDYDQYRGEHPDWCSSHANRTLACFIHDRIWFHLIAAIGEMDNVAIRDNDPTREVWYQNQYQIRIKRHSSTDMISTYPTATAVEFWSNGQATIPGLESHTLALGYRWDPELREVCETILSYRTGIEEPVWAAVLKGTQENISGFTWEPISPQLPDIDLSAIVFEEKEGKSS